MCSFEYSSSARRTAEVAVPLPSFSILDSAQLATHNWPLFLDFHSCRTR